MLSLNENRFETLQIPGGTAWLLGRCMEARGMQELWTRQRPEFLESLRQQAVVQSVESSNRIEGVEVAPGRLLPVVLHGDRPRDRPEEELAGYRRALDYVFSREQPVFVTPDVICKLHELAQAGMCGDAGQYKTKDNSIVEIGLNNERRIRFVPTPAVQTPAMIEELCRSYAALLDADRHPPLLLVATFVFDFLCVHPFRDGNGRVSRLLTTLLLLQHGFSVGRYISLERLVEEEKTEYYRVLGESSAGWHEGKNNLVPFWNFFLTILKGAHQQFQARVEGAGKGPTKALLIRQNVLAWNGAFAVADVAASVPSATSHLVKKVLADLRDEGLLELKGRGRGARWRRR